MTLILFVLGALAILGMCIKLSWAYQAALQNDVEVVLMKSHEPLNTEDILSNVGLERAKAAWHLGRNDFDGKRYEPTMSRLQKALNGLLIQNKIDHFYHGGDPIGYIHRKA